MPKLALPLLLLLSLTQCRDEKIKPGTAGPTDYIKTTVAYNSISGVDANLLSLDIYHYGQSTTSKPVVMYVHGGGWRIGDKSNSMENKASLCYSLDYILVSTNYRLSPTSTNELSPSRIMYPVHNNDVADAVKWVHENINTFGGNPEKIVLMGHSAGAHLVSLTGTSSLFLPARNIPLSTIKGVATIDTEGYDVASQAGAGEAIYVNAFGTDPAVWQEASPIFHLFPNTTYPNFFVAKRGTTERIAMADLFIGKLQSVGVFVSQVNGSQYDHNGINKAIGAPNETAVTEPLKEFFKICFD
jgi:arylformamidase